MVKFYKNDEKYFYKKIIAKYNKMNNIQLPTRNIQTNKLDENVVNNNYENSIYLEQRISDQNISSHNSYFIINLKKRINLYYKTT